MKRWRSCGKRPRYETTDFVGQVSTNEVFTLGRAAKPHYVSASPALAL